MSLFEELKRRNVFRVGAAYLVVGWVVLEVASIVAPALGLPNWTLTLLLFAGLCGLPFALIFAWAFELTPDGLKRTEEVSPTDSITGETGSKLTRTTIVLLSVALLLVLGERFLVRVGPADEPPMAETETAETAPSIAVLPFVNMSDDRANEHFADGIAEELLNLLAQIPDLHVAARTSSFYFKDKDATIADVAKALGVNTVLEGSVRRSGDTIRVVAQLISAEDERHLWSEKYDRPLTDVFAVQDDIASQIVGALLPHLAVELPTTIERGAITPDIYERFLLARQTFYEGRNESTEVAHEEFLAITRAAPAFGPGWSWLARTWLALPDTSPDVALPAAREAIDTALRLNPEDALAFLELGRLYRDEGDNARALANIDRALELDPRLVDALILRQYPLISLGRVEDAIDSLDQARRLDPLHPEVLSQLAHLNNLQGRTAEAFDFIEKLYRVNPVRAMTMEEHLYRDSEEVARAIYFAELDGASGEPRLCQECFAARLLEVGLYEHPVLQASVYRPVALANMGERKAAELALIDALNDVNSDGRRVELQMMTYTALGEYRMASDIVWEYWKSLGADHLSDAFWEMHAMFLGTTSRAAGESERVQTVLPVLSKEMANWSRLHSAGYNAFHAQLALMERRFDDALAFFEDSAAAGDIGGYLTGGPVLFQFQFPDDPRFAAVAEKLVANYDRQMAELDRLRASGMNAEQMRLEYLKDPERSE